MQGLNIQDDREKIELFISCRSLADMDTFSKSDPFVIIYLGQGNNPNQLNWVEIGRTETIMDNLNPNFQKSFILDYIFEIQQHVKFQVWDFDGKNSKELIGEAQSTISKIVGSNNQMCVLDLKNKNQKYSGKIILRASKVAYCNDAVFMKIRLSNIPSMRFFGSTKAFIRIYRQSDVQGSPPLLVFENKHVAENKNPTFQPIEIKAQKLCNGNYDMKILVEVWDFRSSGNHEYIAETYFNISQTLDPANRKFELLDRRNKKKCGFLIFDQINLIERPNFMDYLRGGLQLNIISAIDFTGSNGVVNSPQSLHFLSHNGAPNQYQSAIYSVGDILINYSHDKKIAAYGFGAKPRLPHFISPQTLHCFPINGFPQDPFVVGIQGLMDSYRNILPFVELSGPTYFNPLIQEVMKLAQISKDNNMEQYYVLLIMTDGVIHDMNATITSIVNSSHLPMSIIIIGVGKEDFSQMEILDGDSGLIDSNSRRALRDLVQFVPFENFKGNPTLLAKEVLAELPDQVVDYHKLIGKKPNPPQQIDINNFQVQNVPQSQQQLTTGLAQGNFMKNLLGQAISQQIQQEQIQVNPQLGQQQQFPAQQQQQFQQMPSQFNQPIQLAQGMAQGGFMNNIINQSQQNGQQPFYPQQQFPPQQFQQQFPQQQGMNFTQVPQQQEYVKNQNMNQTYNYPQGP